MRIKVYIASPYTIGDAEANVKRQLDTFDYLLNKNFAPFAPLLFHYAPPRPYQDWIDLDLEWVRACDVLLRLPGESKGADAEVAHAIKYRIPIYFSIDELVDYYSPIF